MSIESIIYGIIEDEGGFVNNKRDRGGPTKYGITLRTLAAWRKTKVTIEDVKNLTKKEAYEILYNVFYIETKICNLPETIQEIILDITVMSWIKVATVILQRAINRIYNKQKVTVDGKLGNKTISTSKEALTVFGEATLINAITDARKDFYKAIVENDPSQSEFLAGWINRANSFKV